MATANHDGTWTLSHAEYQKFVRAYRELAALEAAGVDNWQGYGDALCSLEEDEN